MASRTVVASTSQNWLHNSTWLRHLHNHMNIDEGLSWFTRLLVNYSFLSLRYPFVFSFCFEFSLALPLTSRLRTSFGSGTIFFAAVAQSLYLLVAVCVATVTVSSAMLVSWLWFFAAGSSVSFYSLLSLVSLQSHAALRCLHSRAMHSNAAQSHSLLWLKWPLMRLF